MNILLDSHALLWALSDPGRMLPQAVDTIRDSDNAVFFSHASVWELELKAAKGKLHLPGDWLQVAKLTGFEEVELDLASLIASTRLPWHHQDPFDRVLIAQARNTGFTLATRDGFAPLYDVPVLPV